jgi:hypothetical protein
MEIKDLRVDDAALRDGRVVIITGMSTYKIGADEVRVKDGSNDYSCYVTDLKPIPITDDLLINVGFKEIGNHPNDGNSYELPNSGKFLYCIVFHTLHDTESYEFNIHTESETRNITYLHELQHFVWEHIGIELKIQL